jgi:CRISPR-associated protein Cas1
MEQILNTLFLTQEGSYLHLDHDALKVEIPEQPPRLLPLFNIGSIVVIGNIMVSPQLMSRCAQEGRTITFLDFNGGFLARVEGVISGNVLLRKAQYSLLEQEARKLEISKAFVAGKIRNSRALLMRGARETKESPAADTLRAICDDLEKALLHVQTATNMDYLRGIEGGAAAAYFSAFGHLIRKNRDAWKFQGRTRRPPRDFINAMLSFLYTILTHDVRNALEGVGLDPQAGYLHALRPGRPALALDLMEELRAVFVDRLILARINLGQVTISDFKERAGGAVEMSDEARKELISAYQNRKREEVVHTLTGKKVPLGFVPHLQARILARSIRGEGQSYVPYLMK